jgi:hypothetical protein
MTIRYVGPSPKAERRVAPAKSSNPVRRPVASPAQHLQRRIGNQALARSWAVSQGEGERLQRKAGPAGASQSGGRPLTGEQRAYFEPRFGADFGHVRLHAGDSADSAARAVGALAYTRGSDIVFRKGEYRPESSAGRQLLAHELTHVVQQQGNAAGRIDASRVEPVDSPAEREADHVAARVAAGGQAPAIRQAPAGIPRAALTSDGGEFVMTTYTSFDGDPGKNTRKQCGIDLVITFTPALALRSDQISMVQIMKTEKGGTPFLFPNEKPRATTAEQGDAGWAVDRLEGNKNADYQMGNDGKEVAGWGQLGHRKSAADVRDATLIDGLRLTRDVGQTQKVQATSFALDKTNGKYLGGVAWGYDVDAAGAVTKKAAAIQSKGAPAGIQKSALEQWNAQAKNADVAKRNDPNQVEIKVP